jgi:hypothetical protein
MPTPPAGAVTIQEAAQALHITEDEVQVRLHDRSLLPADEQPPGERESPWIDEASLRSAMRHEGEQPTAPPDTSV